MKGKSPMESACEYLGLNFSELKEYYKEQQIMNTKKTFRIKLDVEFTIDFDGYGFSDAQQSKIEDFKTMILDEYISEVGYDEFEVTGDSSTSLFEVMSEMFNQNKLKNINIL